MFVRQSRYDKVNKELKRVVLAYDELALKWTRLVREINNKGGQDFLDKAILPENHGNSLFTKKEIKVLLSLVHPDKNEGSQIHEEITKKLTKLL